MDSLGSFLKSTRREDRICAVLLSLNMIDQDSSGESESGIVNHVFQELGMKFLLDMISCLVQYHEDSRYLMIGTSAVRFLGVACKYEKLCRLVNQIELTQLIVLCFEERIQSDAILSNLIFSIIKFVACSSVESTEFAIHKILATAAENMKKRKIVGSLLRTTVDLLQICRESSVLCNTYGDTILSLIVQGVHGATPAEERADALSCLRDLLSIGDPHGQISLSWTWTMKRRAPADEPAAANSERNDFFFPVFLTDVVTGELHLLMEELLAFCSQSDQVRADEEAEVTARRLEQQIDAPLQLVTMFLSAVVEEDSAWATLPTQSMQKILRALKIAAKDCADFLVEAAAILGCSSAHSGGGAKAVGLEGEQGRGPTAARGVLVAAAERTLTVLSLFVLEDDAATELLLTAVPHVIRLGRQESKKLLVMLYECLLERIWGLEDKTTNKQLEIQLRAVLDIDGPLVECAVTHLTEELSAIIDTSGCRGSLEENVVRVLAEILMLANVHWTKQAEQFHTTVEILLRSDRDDTLICSLAKLKEAIQKAIVLTDETLKVSLRELLFCLGTK